MWNCTIRQCLQANKQFLCPISISNQFLTNFCSSFNQIKVKILIGKQQVHYKVKKYGQRPLDQIQRISLNKSEFRIVKLKT